MDLHFANAEIAYMTAEAVKGPQEVVASPFLWRAPIDSFLPELSTHAQVYVVPLTVERKYGTVCRHIRRAYNLIDS